MTEVVGKNKILLVNGRAVKGGNTDCMAECLVRGIESAGGVVDVVRLSELTMKYPGCSGCLHCQRNYPTHCAFQDDFGELAYRVPEYDILLFVTPCYFHGATAKTRCFLERLYSLYDIAGGTNRMAEKGMRWALALDAGDPPEGGLTVTDRAFFEETVYAHIPYKSWLVPATSTPGCSPKENEKIREEGRAFGAMLADWH